MSSGSTCAEPLRTKNQTPTNNAASLNIANRIHGALAPTGYKKARTMRSKPHRLSTASRAPSATLTRLADPSAKGAATAKSTPTMATDHSAVAMPFWSGFSGAIFVELLPSLLFGSLCFVRFAVRALERSPHDPYGGRYAVGQPD